MADVKWIKITTDMFDNEKIRIIESMPDSDAILVIWIKLLTLAGKINADGYIFIREDIAYTEETLASVMDRPLNTVRLAINVFENYGMLHRNGEHLVVTNWEKHQSIEGLNTIREQTRLRVSKYRERHKLLQAGNVTVACRNATDKNRIDKNREEEEEICNELLPFEDIDEDNTLICSQSITTIRQILKGEKPALDANKKRYREELKKRGWLEAIEGVN